MGLFDWMSAQVPTPAAIRAEVWSLGVRHHGHPLEGALQELEDGPATPARTALLRACVQQMRRG